MKESECINVDEAIEYSGKSRSTIYRYIYNGIIEAEQDFSKVWHINKDSLDKVLKQRRSNK